MKAKSSGPSFTPRQVLEDPACMALSYDEQACAVLTEAARYISQVLTAPDPRLGRPGPVCPFAGGAVQRDMITLTVLPLFLPDLASLREAALSLKAEFDLAETGPLSRRESLRAVMILLPYLKPLDAMTIVESVQKELKPTMVQQGLMIGEFYPGCTLPGLNNPSFRPADTSFACLAIRRMAAADLPFLVDDADFLESYFLRFGKDSTRKPSKAWPAPLSSPLQAIDKNTASLVAESVEHSNLGLLQPDRLDMRSL